MGQYIKDAAAASRLEEQEMKGVCACACVCVSSFLKQCAEDATIASKLEECGCVRTCTLDLIMTD